MQNSFNISLKPILIRARLKPDFLAQFKLLI